MRQGYTIVLSGWDVTVAAGSGRFTMTVPAAKNPNGSAIVGPSLEEFVIEDEHGRRVFDANLDWIGGASGGFFNYQFAQPGRTHRQHIGRWYPERQFPFTNQILRDRITGKIDGVLRQCLATHTCPKIFEVNSENEYWAKAGSLLHTDTRGNDLDLSRAEWKQEERGERDHERGREREDDDDVPANVRYYLLSSLPHTAGVGPIGLGICQQPRNPLVANSTLRALLIALDGWVTHDDKPPRNAVPRRSNGTLVPDP